MPTEDAYSSEHLILSLLGLAKFVLLVETSNTLYRLDIIPVCDIITGRNIFTESEFPKYWFPKSICNRCGMRTGDAYSSGHLVLSHFGTCECSNVETNLSLNCLVSGLLSFEHPSVLLFLLVRTNITMINFIYALSHVLINCTLKTQTKRFNDYFSSGPIAEWLE